MRICTGHLYGTGCQHRNRSKTPRINWDKWQLCHKCARILHPEYYQRIHKESTEHQKIDVYEESGLIIHNHKSLFDRLD